MAEPEPERPPLAWAPAAAGAGQATAFHAACSLAVGQQRPLALPAGAVIELETPLKLKARQRLVLCGHAAVPAVLSGACHSLFELKGRAGLELRHVQLRHTAAPPADAPGDNRTVSTAGTCFKA